MLYLKRPRKTGRSRKLSDGRFGYSDLKEAAEMHMLNGFECQQERRIVTVGCHAVAEEAVFTR